MSSAAISNFKQGEMSQVSKNDKLGNHLTNGSLVAPGEEDKTLDYIKGALKIYSGMWQFGAVLLPPPANIACGVLAGLGWAFAAGIEAFQNKPDEVQEKFKEVKKKITDMEEIIVKQFGKLKVFISDNKFSMEVIAEVATLKKFMFAILDLYDVEAIENFREAYEQTSPLEIAYTLSSLLSQESTNPLAMALEKNPKEREESLKNWKDIIKTIVNDLLLLESFAAGLLKRFDMYDCERMISEFDTINGVLDEKEEHYNIGPWSTFKKNFPDFAKRLHSIGYDKKTRADHIKEKLSKDCPNDSFYICVFDSGKFEEEYYYYAKEYNIIEVKDLGYDAPPHSRKFSVLIYRSYNSKYLKEKDFNILKEKMELEKDFDPKKTNKWLVEQEVIKKKGYPSNGLVSIFNNETGVYIDSANCPRYAHGPGYWKFMRLGEGKESRHINWIVGFP